MSEKIAKTTTAIVEDGVQQLAKEVTQKGRDALIGKAALENVESTFKDIAYKQTHKLLKELNLYEHTKKVCLNILNEIDQKSVKEIQERLTKLGLSEEAAEASAKSLKKALKKGLSDDELAEIFTEQITREVTNALLKEMETPFKQQFAKALAGESTTKAGKQLAQAMEEKGIKLSKQEIDDLVEAGWKGCREGVEKAVREVVEKAVKDAFKEFRDAKRRLRPSIGLGSSSDLLIHSAAEQEEAIINEAVEEQPDQQPAQLIDGGSKLDLEWEINNTILDKATERHKFSISG